MSSDEESRGVVRRGLLRIDPAANPAILDTLTWDEPSLVPAIRARFAASSAGAGEPSGGGSTSSVTLAPIHAFGGSRCYLAALGDGRRAICTVGDTNLPLGVPIDRRVVTAETLDGSRTHEVLSIYPAHIDYLFRLLEEPTEGRSAGSGTNDAPTISGPIALGPVPRLGIGTRHSVLVFPGIWDAMSDGGFHANAIQNSLRELALLDDLLRGEPIRTNHLFNFGSVPEAHTGSTFEGLLLAGTVSAIESGCTHPFGADADHIQVKRGSGGITRAREVIRAARHYSFFTLDVSDVLDYDAPTDPRRSAQSIFDNAVPSQGEQRRFSAYHRRPRQVAGFRYAPSEDRIARLAGKYAFALDAVVELDREIRMSRSGRPYDLELSIDETPSGVSACNVITAEDELVFVLLELKRRGIPISHVAPNLGIEKGTDIRCAGGVPALANRVRNAVSIADFFHAMVDCHSGDDLSRATRRAIGAAAEGRIHFKISPSLQDLFADVLFETEPKLFAEWAARTVAFVAEQAAAGHPAAIELFGKENHSSRDKSTANTVHSPTEPLFRKFCFAPVGLRDSSGRYPLREALYGCSAESKEAYRRRVARLLAETASDIFGS